MTFGQALVGIMWVMILKEVPAYRQNPASDGAKAYRDDIAAMVEVDRKVALAGHLVDPQVDRVILGGIRFYEGRFRSKPKDGDCVKNWHRYRHLPSSRWPKGYKPVFETKCPAKGPMQVVEGNLRVLSAWPETRIMFDGIKPWKQEVESGANPWKLKRATLAELRTPEINVRFGYSMLWHFKNTCAGRPSDHRDTPVGSWLTAFGWGRCPPPSWKSVLYVDAEGRRRCDTITTMMQALEDLSRRPNAVFSFAVPQDWWCGHEKTVKPKQIRSLPQPEKTE